MSMLGLLRKGAVPAIVAFLAGLALPRAAYATSLPVTLTAGDTLYVRLPTPLPPASGSLPDLVTLAFDGPEPSSIFGLSLTFALYGAGDVPVAQTTHTCTAADGTCIAFEVTPGGVSLHRTIASAAFVSSGGVWGSAVSADLASFLAGDGLVSLTLGSGGPLAIDHVNVYIGELTSPNGAGQVAAYDSSVTSLLYGVNVHPVPEPSACLLLGVALLAILTGAARSGRSASPGGAAAGEPPVG